MNGITKRCISFAQGNKDPYQRVNYPFGLVLGVDEFVDEQCYFLEKEYMHNRALHGCGTISGLHVTVDQGDVDTEVRVSSGVGIDQYGRLFVVHNEQCASLSTWLAEQPGPISQVYVVARYAECETELVPIAGQPCSSSEQSSAPSRIKDFFEIDFMLAPPTPHLGHNAAINLAEFLNRLRVDPNTGFRSDLLGTSGLSPIIGPDVITRSPHAFRLHLDERILEITDGPNDQLLTISPAQIDALLDNIFTYWITEVRPTLVPDLITPSVSSEPDIPVPAAEILLARIDITTGVFDPMNLVAETVGDGAAIEEEEAVEEEPNDGSIHFSVDNSVRPYLLHTQLIQELFDVQNSDKPIHEFVTIEDISFTEDGELDLLLLWIHIDDEFDLITESGPQQNVAIFQIDDDGGLNPITPLNTTARIDQRADGGQRFELEIERPSNGRHFLLRFNTDNIFLGTSQQRLTDRLDSAPYTFFNYDSQGKEILAYHIAERINTLNRSDVIDIIEENRQPDKLVFEFATIENIVFTEDGEANSVLLWIHIDDELKLVAEPNPEPNISLSRIDDAGVIIPIIINIIEKIDLSPDGGRRFELRIQEPLNDGDHLLLNFDTDAILIQTSSGERSLTTIINAGQSIFLNYEPEKQRILDYHIVHLPQPILTDGGGEPVPDEPMYEFATIEDSNASELSVWLHVGEALDLIPEQNQSQNVFLFRIRANGERGSLQFTLEEDSGRANEFGRYYKLSTTGTKLNNGDHLVLRFDTGKIPVFPLNDNRSLSDLIENEPLTFANYNRTTEELIAYHIVERAVIDRQLIENLIQGLLPPPRSRVPFVTITPITTVLEAIGPVVGPGDEAITEPEDIVIIGPGRPEILDRDIPGPAGAEEPVGPFIPGPGGGGPRTGINLSYELWFHLDKFVDQNDGEIDLTPDNVLFFVELENGSSANVPISIRRTRHNVWQVETQQVGVGLNLRFLSFVRFVFPLEERLMIKIVDPITGVEEIFNTLGGYVDQTQQQLEGHIMDLPGVGDALVIYVRGWIPEHEDGGA